MARQLPSQLGRVLSALLVLLTVTLMACAARSLPVSGVLQEGNHAHGMLVELTGDVVADPLFAEVFVASAR